MQSEILLQTSWPTQSYFHPNSDHYDPNMGFYESEYDEFPSSANSTPENSLISSEPYVELPLLGYDQMQNPSMVDNDSHNINTLDDVCQWLCDDNQEIEEIQSERPTESVHVCSPDLSMTSDDVMELESQTGLEDLLKAYADAMEMGQKELAKVLVRCISENTNPIGPVIDRIAFNLFKSAENQGDAYLKEELMRNFKSAFRAFYDIFPYGRFAHFTANSVILESVPSHVESIHIVDFDLGEGSQWPPVIKAVAQQRQSLIITSVKLEEHDLNFRETKKQLSDYARDVGANLKVEEVELAQMVKVMVGKLDREFVAFNCMSGLPHMRSTRKRTQVIEFLNLAKELLAKHEGVITLGDGENGDRMENSSNYPSFFDENLSHYKALYESMEWGIPSYLNEARIALETLFIAPSISSLSWFQKWEEGQEEVVSVNGIGLNGQLMNIESLNEAKELVNERESAYGIRIGGDNGNEMVLEWRGTPLVKVSAWV